jgi:hypothetical protein
LQLRSALTGRAAAAPPPRRPRRAPAAAVAGRTATTSARRRQRAGAAAPRSATAPAPCRLPRRYREVIAVRAIAQVTTALDAAQRAVEYASALNEADWDR